MEFQIYDYMEDHETLDDVESDSEDNNEVTLPKFIIHIFGRTLEGKSVYCKLQDYTPHFYIKLPSKWGTSDAKSKLKIMYKWFQSSDNKKVWKKFRDGLISINMITKKDAIGFTNDKEFNFARLVFSNSFAMKKFRYMLEQNKINIPRVTKGDYQFKCYEANLPPMLRCFHIRKISGCSWVRVEKYKQIELECEKNSYCDIELNVNWNNIEPIEKDCNAPLRIASFDIECTSIDGQFPMARRKGDKVIQIGTTYTTLGESVPYRQHIVCLEKTDPVEDAVTEWYDDERDLILAWKKEIIRSDCDIITGYNIFFFDEKYVYDRCCEHLGIKYEMSLLSKLKNFECNFRDFKLASSALGENQLRYWDTPGRVHVDLMKDVQKTYNLSSYKLDDVASNFIRGKINKLEKSKMKSNKYKYLLQCANVDDIYDNDYIHIEHVKSFVSDYVGYKYFVNHVDKDKKTISFESDIEISEVDEGDLFWSQAKDDVGPQDIFRLQKGNSADRSIVAKYCVKDCRLVNVLVNKLEVVTKNIEMANVCYVPFSYLFVRGQGVKLFSLCLKTCRDHGYLFPVLKKPEDNDSGYEGAIVFDPIPSVYYEPLVTKDYASLYPSSILQKNMSWETMVRDSEYDELGDIKYYNAQFKQNDGEIKHVRFAQKEGKLGVVPTILNNLLKERKAVKKQMKVEKDQFKYKIKDAKQLALKVTANSLYGQLGAPTSPVYLKAIAACTTSTGREMLIFAKKYDEEILPGFINGLKYAYLNNDINMAKKIYQLELKDYSNDNFEENKLIKQIEKFVKEDIADKIFNPIVRYGDTDSVFTCFRFKDEVKELSDKKSLKLLKKVIKLSKKLLLYFLPEEHHEMYENIFNEYYAKDKITELKLPEPPKVLPVPEHWNTLLPIEERMKQFIKEYMEESYFPWLWTLQDLFTDFRYKFNDDQFEELLAPKLYNWGEYLVEKMRISPYSLQLDLANIKIEVSDKTKEVKELRDEYKLDKKTIFCEDKEILEKYDTLKQELDELITTQDKFLNIKNKFIEELNEFFKEEIPKNWIEPFWKIDDNMNREVHFKLWKKGKAITDKRGLDLSIELGIISGDTVKNRLPFPHDLEYEKTFWPFLILTKKRYVGNKFEFDKEKYKQDFMGIVLKRRDNAPIVKEICNGIIDSLINHKDPKRAKKYTKKCLKDMFNNNYDINYFVTSKTLKLKESYKDWTRIAHVVLAERIGIRDPGNRPQSGDRISFAAIKVLNKTKDALQGDMIETPEYIKEKGIELDYLFYMTNQIMKPALQFLELALKDAENIFNPYIFKDKIDELVKDKIEVSKFIANYKKEEIDEDQLGAGDYSDMKIDQLTELIENLKKEVRKLKCEQRRVIKLIDKEKNEKAINV